MTSDQCIEQQQKSDASSERVQARDAEADGFLTVGVFDDVLVQYQQLLLALLREQTTIHLMSIGAPGDRSGDGRSQEPARNTATHGHGTITTRLQQVVTRVLALYAIARRRSDVIMLMNDTAAGIDEWIGLLLLRLIHRHVILWAPDNFATGASVPTLVGKLMIALADAVLVHSEGSRQFWIQNGVRPEKLFVAYASMDPRNLAAIKRSILPGEQIDYRNRHQWGDKKVVMFDSRRVSEQQIALVLGAMRRVIERHANVHLAMIGDGPMKEFVRQQIEVLNIPHMVTMLGDVTDEVELGLIYLNTIAAIHPASEGSAIIHAFSYGVPLILGRGAAKQSPEAELVIERETGFLCRFDSVDEFADAVCLLLENRHLHRTLSGNMTRLFHEKYNSVSLAAGIVDAVRYSAQI